MRTGTCEGACAMRCSCINPASIVGGWRGWLGFPGHLRDKRLAAYLFNYLFSRRLSVGTVGGDESILPQSQVALVPREPMIGTRERFYG